MKKILTIVVITVMSFLTTQAQWTSEASGFATSPQRGIIEMVAVNANVAWAMSYPRGNYFSGPWAEFTSTSDGGNHWTAGSINGIPDDLVLGIAPLSATTACAISWDITNYTGGRILKTTDGGSTWNTVSDNTMFAGGFPDGIQFFDANNGVAYGDPNGGYFEIYTTSNGGDSWTKVPQANIPAPLANEYGVTYAMSIVNNTVWFVSIYGDGTLSRIFKSYDKGMHWFAYSNIATGTGAAAFSLKMRDQNHGLLKSNTGTTNDLYRTSNGGITWTLVNTTGNFFAFDLAYVHGTPSTWVSTGGELNSVSGIGSSYSTDDGNTWTTIDIGVDHQAIDMVNQYVGFTGGFNTSTTTDGIFSYTGAAVGCGCNTPTSTSTVGVTGTTAMAMWTNPSCYYNNSIRISRHGLNTWTTYNFTNSHYTFSALARSTQYDWQVRTNCNAGMTATSGWSAIQSFTTLAHREAGFTNSDFAFNIYPNPANNQLTVSFNAANESSYSIKLIDLTGRIVNTEVDNSIAGENSHTMNLNGIAKGIYVVELQMDQAVLQTKIVVQ